MKKLGIALILSVLVISGCTSTSKKKKRSSSIEQSSQISEEGTSTNSNSGNTSASSAPTISSTSNSSISGTPQPTDPIIENLEVEGYKDTFKVGDEFYFGGTAIVTYEDGSQEDVTSKVEFDGFDSSAVNDQLSIIVKYSNNSSIGATNYYVSIVSDITNLGKLKIGAIKDYMEAHPITVPTDKKCAVDYKTKVTFEGVALESVNLIKYNKFSGLEDSFPAKIIFGDDTGYIAVTGTGAEGKLIDGVKSHVGKETSKYTIVGYLSVYLEHYEIVVDEVETDKNGKNGWDQTLPVTCDVAELSKKDITIEEFYNLAKDNNYNCAGHGYGEIYTIKNATCYFSDAGDNIYYLTDGTRLLKVINHNRPDLSEGKVYDVVGLLSMLNYSGSIYLQKATEVTGSPISLDLTSAIEKNIIDLKKIKASQDDTNTRYPDFTLFWSHLYKTTGYLTTCVQDGKYYIGIRDTYYTGKDPISGQVQAQTTYNMALIDNENFWNVSEENLEHYNPYFDDIDEETPVDVYYIPQQLDYTKGEARWKIFLLPSTFPMIYE